MKAARIQDWVKWILVLCCIGLIAVLFFPMWRIDLQAPQYPEGLRLLIYPDKIGGNVDIINGLNHYIGMKTMHTEDFVEFTVLPYIISFFAVSFLLVAVAGRKKLLYILFILFVSFGIIAMYDFWRWEYNYGHNLNPEAAIIVPGMAYQPPLIGFKQLLNFGAYSIPDIGGWIFIVVGLLLCICVVTEWRLAVKMKNKPAMATILCMVIIGLPSCSTQPEAIKTGIDNCSFCKMTVSDVRFGAELITKKGKIYKFDDAHCLVNFLQNGEVDSANIAGLYFTDFCNNHSLFNVKEVSLLKSDKLRSPMGGNIAAFSNNDSLLEMQLRFPGSSVNWDSLLKP